MTCGSPLQGKAAQHNPGTPGGVLVSLADNDELTKGSWLNTKQYFILTGSVRVFRAQITQNVDQLAATVSWEHLGSCTGINYKDVA